jgi:hypothetical protein
MQFFRNCNESAQLAQLKHEICIFNLRRGGGDRPDVLLLPADAWPIHPKKVSTYPQTNSWATLPVTYHSSQRGLEGLQPAGETAGTR